eukprot:1830979-Pyramimonas_sp.AAC.1
MNLLQRYDGLGSEERREVGELGRAGAGIAVKEAPPPRTRNRRLKAPRSAVNSAGKCIPQGGLDPTPVDVERADVGALVLQGRHGVV